MSDKEQVETVKETRGTKVSRNLTPADMEAAVLSTKAMLDRQPKRKVRLRKADDPKMPNYETVQINGYTFTIMKGVEVEVPEEVYNILVNANLY